jgi:hypothetical protein
MKSNYKHIFYNLKKQEKLYCFSSPEDIKFILNIRKIIKNNKEAIYQHADNFLDTNKETTSLFNYNNILVDYKAKKIICSFCSVEYHYKSFIYIETSNAKIRNRIYVGNIDIVAESEGDEKKFNRLYKYRYDTYYFAGNVHVIILSRLLHNLRIIEEFG